MPARTVLALPDHSKCLVVNNRAVKVSSKKGQEFLRNQRYNEGRACIPYCRLKHPHIKPQYEQRIMRHRQGLPCVRNCRLKHFDADGNPLPHIHQRGQRGRQRPQRPPQRPQRPHGPQRPRKSSRKKKKAQKAAARSKKR